MFVAGDSPSRAYVCAHSIRLSTATSHVHLCQVHPVLILIIGWFYWEKLNVVALDL
jgi:hypothetical protein